MSKNKKKQHSLSPTIPGLSVDVGRFMSDLEKETDRGAALVAAAFIDDVLKSMLIAKFVDRPKNVKQFLEYPRPLSTFSSRIELAYLLGLIGPKMYKGLKQIQKIRNDFAHSHKSLSFEDVKVSKKCEELNLIDLSSLNLNPRNHFLNQSMILADLLLVRGLSLKHFDVGKDFNLSKIISG